MDLVSDERTLLGYLFQYCPTADQTSAIAVGLQWATSGRDVNASHTTELERQFGQDWSRFATAIQSLRDKGLTGLKERKSVWECWITEAGRGVVAEPSSAHSPVDLNPRSSLWERITAVVAAFVGLTLIAYVIVRNESFPDANIVVLFRGLVSLSFAVFVATVPGFLNFTWKGKSGVCRAGGALAVFVVTLTYTPTVLKNSATSLSTPPGSLKDEYEKEVEAALTMKERRVNVSWKLSVTSLNKEKTEASVKMGSAFTLVNTGDSTYEYPFGFLFDTTVEFAVRHQQGKEGTVKGEVTFYRKEVAIRPTQEVIFEQKSRGSTRYTLLADSVKPFRLLPKESVDVEFHLVTPIGVKFPISDYWIHGKPVIGLKFEVEYGGLPLETEVRLLRGNEDGVRKPRETGNGYQYMVGGAFLAYQGVYVTVREKR